MISLVADTNTFLRFLLKDNTELFRKTRAILIKAKENKLELIVPQIVIFEIAFALEKYYQFPKNQIIEGLQTIVSSNQVKIQDQTLFKKALTLYAQHNVSLVDCFLTAYSQEKNAQIFTFDKSLKKLLKDL